MYLYTQKYSSESYIFFGTELKYGSKALSKSKIQIVQIKSAVHKKSMDETIFSPKETER